MQFGFEIIPLLLFFTCSGFYLLGTGWLGLLSVAYFGYARINLGWLLLGCALPLVAVFALVWQAERRNGTAAPA